MKWLVFLGLFLPGIAAAGNPKGCDEMSVIDFLAQRPDLAIPRFIWADVSAPINSDQEYHFELTGVTVNPSPLFRAIAGAWYLIDSFSWRLNGVDELDYSKSAATVKGYNGPLAVRLFWDANQNSSIQLMHSIPLPRFFEWFPVRAWTLPPNNEGDTLLRISVAGGINPSLWTTPPDPLPETLTARFMFRLFEIKDKEFADRLNALGIGGLGLCHAGADGG